MTIEVRQLAQWGSTASFGGRAVLCALAEFADETGRCWPSLRLLMRITGASERTIRDHLRQLEAQGELSATHRPNQSNIYQLNLELLSARVLSSDQAQVLAAERKYRLKLREHLASGKVVIVPGNFRREHPADFAPGGADFAPPPADFAPGVGQISPPEPLEEPSREYLYAAPRRTSPAQARPGAGDGGQPLGLDAEDDAGDSPAEAVTPTPVDVDVPFEPPAAESPPSLRAKGRAPRGAGRQHGPLPGCEKNHNPRPRNPLFDALVSAVLGASAPLPRSRASSFGKAAAELAVPEVAATPEQVHAVVGLMRREWGERYRVTETAVVKWWPEYVARIGGLDSAAKPAGVPLGARQPGCYYDEDGAPLTQITPFPDYPQVVDYRRVDNPRRVVAAAYDHTGAKVWER